MDESEGVFAGYCKLLEEGKLHKRPRRIKPKDEIYKTTEELLPFTDLTLLKMYAAEGMQVSIYPADEKARSVTEYLCRHAHNGVHNCNITVGRSKEGVEYEIKKTYTGNILADAVTAAELGIQVLVTPVNRRSRRLVGYIRRISPYGLVNAVSTDELSKLVFEEVYPIRVDNALEMGLFSDTEMWLLGWPTTLEMKQMHSLPLSEKDEKLFKERSQEKLVSMLRQRCDGSQSL